MAQQSAHADRNHVPQISTARVTYSFLASAAAEVVTFPIDIIRTRLQLYGQHTNGSFAIIKLIHRHEGFAGFFRGVLPAAVRQCIYSPVRILFYEHLRESLRTSNLPTIWIQTVCGVGSGIIGQLVSSPFDLIKVRMQADGHQVQYGKQPRYHSMGDCISQAVRHGGVRELWVGWVPNCTRAALVNTAEILGYEQAKGFLTQHTTMQGDHITVHAVHRCSLG